MAAFIRSAAGSAAARPQHARRTPTAPLALHLQRTAGNRAVACLLASGQQLQRHASFEHTLIGNTSPDKLGHAVKSVSEANRKHLLLELHQQSVFFQNDATKDPRKDFPDVRWIQLKASKLWLSYGELNSMADYLPGAEDLDHLERGVVEPVLQRMRAGSAAHGLRIKLGNAKLPGIPAFKGQADAGSWEAVDAVATDKAMDSATSSLGEDRYFGLVSRNACHFAPESWHRWAAFHQEGIAHAEQFHATKGSGAVPKDIDRAQDEHLRLAWLNNGYGDHFLQDSFAAGHLINKTLVMQWFLDYVNQLPGWSWKGYHTKPWYGMPDKDVRESMGSKQQPNVAGQGLYHLPSAGAASISDERRSGTAPTDPQTAMERETRAGRIGGTGVVGTKGRDRDDNYMNFQAFLNSAFLSLAAGEAHDRMNAMGLTVVNSRGDRMKVGGDSSMLTISDQKGAELVARAAQWSQLAIKETLEKGHTGISVDKVAAYFPNQVWVPRTPLGEWDKGKVYPLRDWNEQWLHDHLRFQVFPNIVDSIASKVVRLGQPQLVEAGIPDPV